MTYTPDGSQGSSSFRSRPLPTLGIYPSIQVGRATTLAVGHMEMRAGRPFLTKLVSLFVENGVIYASFREVGCPMGILFKNGGATYRAYPMFVASLPLFAGQPNDPNDVQSQMWVARPGAELVIAHAMGEGNKQGRPFETSFDDEYGAAGATHGVGSVEAKRYQGLFEIWERTQLEPVRRPMSDGFLGASVPKSAGPDVMRGSGGTSRNNSRRGTLEALITDGDERSFDPDRGNISAVSSTADVSFGDAQTVDSTPFHGKFNRDALKLPDIRLVGESNIMDRVAERLRCDVRDIPWTTPYAYGWENHEGYLPPARIHSHVPRRPPPTTKF